MNTIDITPSDRIERVLDFRTHVLIPKPVVEEQVVTGNPVIDRRAWTPVFSEAETQDTPIAPVTPQPAIETPRYLKPSEPLEGEV